jgi:uncharacterized protein (TIGR00288 family)
MKKRSLEKKIAIFVDGPNLLRKEFTLDLSELRRKAERYGKIVVAKVFLNQFAPEKLIEAIINEGFKVEMVLAEKEDMDVDVSLAVDAMETLLTKNIDVLILATRDTDFIPLIHKAKEYGKEVIVFGVNKGFSAALRNAADKVEVL